jgi:hypothetical protein
MPGNTNATYRTLRFDEFSTRPNCAEEVATHWRMSTAAGTDGQTLGVWIPMIGVSNNTVTVGTLYTGEPPALTVEPSGPAEDITHARSRVFDTLTRGQMACSAYPPGIFTHRWFVVRPEHVQEMTYSSIEAWKSAEQDTAMRVVGFWRARDLGADGEATILMIVYYPDLAAWDASRFWKPAPKGESQPHRQVWGELFRKRRDITLNSWVTVHRLGPAVLPGPVMNQQDGSPRRPAPKIAGDPGHE